VPREVIASARRYLERLESAGSRADATGTASVAQTGPEQGLTTLNPQSRLDLAAAAEPHAALELLTATDPDLLTPREALQLLYDLKAKL